VAALKVEVMPSPQYTQNKTALCEATGRIRLKSFIFYGVQLGSLDVHLKGRVIGVIGLMCFGS